MSPPPLGLCSFSAGNTLTKESFLSLSAPGTGRHTAVVVKSYQSWPPLGGDAPTLTWKLLPHLLSRQSGAKMRQEEARVRVAPPWPAGATS